MRRMTVAIDHLVMDESTQQRTLFDSERIAEYAEWLQNGGTFPPITVFSPDHKQHYLADGWYRVQANVTVGNKVIEADVIGGGLRDAVLYSCGANTDHGLKRTAADAHKAIRRLLADDEWGRWSATKIAAACKVSRSTVERVKAEMIDEAKPTADVPEERQPVLYDLTAKQRKTLTELADAATRWLPILEDMPGKVGKKVQAVLDEVAVVFGAES